MLTSVSKSVYVPCGCKSESKPINNAAYDLYLTHKDFYRNDCFKLLYEKTTCEKGSKQFEAKKQSDLAICGHALFDTFCGGCPRPLCWNRCKCSDFEM